jgi:hypothetical protein
MDDGPPSSVTTADRLKLLRDHQVAWKNLAWTKISIFPSHGLKLFTRMLVGGVLGLTSQSGFSIHFTQVPSSFRGIEERSWTIEISFQVGYFTMDPSQDLLVVFEV